MAPKEPIIPRLIIHGGAGNILPANLPPTKYTLYRNSLLSILCNTHHFLTSPSVTPTSALDAVTYAVSLLEDNPLFNSGHGAVFTRDGINELEASIMVSRGKKKRGTGVMGLRTVRNPIKLAREMLLRGEEDLESGKGVKRGPIYTDLTGDEGVDEGHESAGTGAQGHSQLHKYSAEKLAREWGLEIVDKSYFFVQTRWDEHIRGLEKERQGKGIASWDAQDFIPQGTCGACALDSEGVLAVATSTGGMTNKLTGRIGDTPTLGAGFWAEEWWEEGHKSPFDSQQLEERLRKQTPVLEFTHALRGLFADCFPSLGTYSPIPVSDEESTRKSKLKLRRSTAMSGTGNGDSFLRICAVRTASAICRYRPHASLQDAVTEISGPYGELVKSAGTRWQKTGEGEGGIIGIELNALVEEDGEIHAGRGNIVQDFNCGGMFRALINDEGKAVMRVWKDRQYADLDKYEGEGREEEVSDWIEEKLHT